MKRLIKRIQWISSRKEHECVRFVSRIRRTNEEKTKSQIKNSSLFSKKRHNHYLILSHRNKENRLKLWATIRRFRLRWKSIAFFLNDVCDDRREFRRRSNDDSELKIDSKTTFRWDVTNDAISFFSELKISLKENSLDELLLEARSSLTSFCDDFTSLFSSFSLDATSSFFWSFIELFSSTASSINSTSVTLLFFSKIAFFWRDVYSLSFFWSSSSFWLSSSFWSSSSSSSSFSNSLLFSTSSSWSNARW